MKPKEQSFGAEVKAEEGVPEGTQGWKETFGFHLGVKWEAGSSQDHAD